MSIVRGGKKRIFDCPIHLLRYRTFLQLPVIASVIQLPHPPIVCQKYELAFFSPPSHSFSKPQSVWWLFASSLFTLLPLLSSFFLPHRLLMSCERASTDSHSAPPPSQADCNGGHNFFFKKNCKIQDKLSHRPNKWGRLSNKKSKCSVNFKWLNLLN